MKDLFWEAFGWYGLLAVLGAYAGASFGYIATDGPVAALLNGTGAAGIAASSFRKRAYQPFALNVVWCVIAVLAAFRALR